MKGPSKAQVTALAWAVRRAGGFMRSIDFDYLGVKDATVAALEVAGWADRVRFYDDVRKWCWWWFHVTDAGKALPAVVAEVARLRACDAARDARGAAEDDAAERLDPAP